METLTFQAETGRLLDLVIHSLYTQREIFLRELISNASDALDRFQFESLMHPDWIEADNPPGIRLEVNRQQRTLTIRDNGIGMSREDVVRDIGTVARSGTQELLTQLRSAEGRGQTLDLIGRFGVGFYSSFMAAERVTIVTRKAGEPRGTRWESTGNTEYTIDDAGPDVPRGTAITLHLRAVDTEGGIEDYTDRWVLSRIVKRYSDFITHPITYVNPDAAADDRAPDAPESAESADAPNEPATVVLNSMKPIWTRPASEVTAEEYAQFYAHIAQSWGEPLHRMAFKAEGRWEYSALLFVPPHAPYDLHYQGTTYGLQLYSQRVMILEHCQQLLPRYLRFLKGVVDAADLPLNVSRQSLQDAHHLDHIRRWLTRKTLDNLAKLRDQESEKYLTFWKEFGRVLKEGISEDTENRERLTPLLLFASSHDPAALTTLTDYVTRMKPGQDAIFYLTGESRAVCERSPHVEEFLTRGYEVCYFTDPVDELLVQYLTEFNGHRLRSVAKGEVELGDEADREQTAREHEERTKAFEGVLAFLKEHLTAHVRDVRLSRRLRTSPACIAGDDHDTSPQLERLLRGSGGGPKRRRILELNATHPLVQRLQARWQADATDPVLKASADVLLGTALLAEGSELADPVNFTSQVTDLVVRILNDPQPAAASPAAADPAAADSVVADPAAVASAAADPEPPAAPPAAADAATAPAPESEPASKPAHAPDAGV